MTDLGTLPDGPNSSGDGLNNLGQVVGGVFDSSGNPVGAFVWQNGVMTDLNTLIPSDSPLYLLEATSINDWGQIAGYAFDAAAGEVHAFLATPVYGTATGETSAPAAQIQKPQITVPENVRELLRQYRSPGRIRTTVGNPQ